MTKSGAIDLLGEIVGVGSFDELKPSAVEVELFGLTCRCASLDQPLRAKRAAGRPKDFEVIAELESLRDSRDD